LLLTGLHAIAARRGDGLRPELLALLRHRETHFNTAIAEISRHRGDDFVQSGPNPQGRTGATLPEGVLRFPERAQTPSRNPEPTSSRLKAR